MSMNWDQLQADYLAVGRHVTNELAGAIDRLASGMAERIRKGGKILACGNGGSAADAQHLVGELVGRFYLERKGYPAVSLTTDTSVMTAVANDYAYEEVFRKQVEALGVEGDVLIAISTSGNSEGVCRAVEEAKSRKLWTIAFVGGPGGRLAEMADEILSISCSTCTPRIQEGHGLIIHALCEQVEAILR